MSDTNFKILSFDPGITCMGWSFNNYNLESGLYTALKWGTIKSSGLAQKEAKADFKAYGTVVSLYMLEQEALKLMEMSHPDFVFTEDAFYNPKRHDAYLSLKLCITTLAKMLYHVYRKPLYKLAPTLIKKILCGNGMASKEAIQDSLVKKKDILLKNTKQNPISDMVEHEADSIAGGYAFSKNILPDLILNDPSLLIQKK